MEFGLSSATCFNTILIEVCECNRQGNICMRVWIEKVLKNSQTDGRYLWVVVGNDPRKHWVLHEIIVWTAGQRVETHQVLKVADFSSLHKRQRKNVSSFSPLTLCSSKLTITKCLSVSSNVPDANHASINTHNM